MGIKDLGLTVQTRPSIGMKWFKVSKLAAPSSSTVTIVIVLGIVTLTLVSGAHAGWTWLENRRLSDKITSEEFHSTAVDLALESNRRGDI